MAETGDWLTDALHPTTPRADDIIGPSEVPSHSALDWLLSGPGTVANALFTGLGTLARPVQTMLHTGNWDRAFESIFDPTLASSSADLRRDLGILPEETTWSESPFTKLGQFGADFAIGLATDPLVWASSGLSTGAKGIQKIAGGLIEKVNAGKLSRAAAEELWPTLLKKAGISESVSLGKSFSEVMSNRGLASTLGERMASGQSVAKLELPFFGERYGLGVELPGIGKMLAPAAEAVGRVGGFAGDILQANAPRTMAAIKWVGNVFKEGTGNQLMDLLTPGAIAKGQEAARQLEVQVVDNIEHMTKTFGNQTAKVLNLAEEAIQTGGNKELQDITKEILRGKLGTNLTTDYGFMKPPYESVAPGMVSTPIKVGVRSRMAENVMEEIRNLPGMTPEKLTVVGQYMNNMKRVYDTSLAVSRAAGGNLQPLGAHLIGEVRNGKRVLIEELRRAVESKAFPTEELRVQVGMAVNASKDFDVLDMVTKLAKSHPDILTKNDSLREAYEALQESAHAALTIPGYSFLKISPEAESVLIAGVKNRPDMARRIMNLNGEIATREEAESILKIFGAPSVGSQVVGKLGVADTIRIFNKAGGYKNFDKGMTAIKKEMVARGKFFESNPAFAALDHLDYLAKAVTNKEMDKSIIRLFGRPIEGRVAELQDMVSELENGIRARRELLRKGGYLTAAEAAAKEGGQFAERIGLTKAAQKATGLEQKLGETISETGPGGIIEQSFPSSIENMRATTSSAIKRAQDLMQRVSKFEKKSVSQATKEVAVNELHDLEGELLGVNRELNRIYGHPATLKATEKVPGGFMKLEDVIGDAGRGRIIETAVGEQILKSKQILRDANQLSQVTKVMASALGTWKGMQISLEPGSWIRNKGGNLFNRAAWGGIDHISASEEPTFIKAMWKMAGAKDRTALMGSLHGTVVNLGERGMVPLDEFITMVRDGGALEMGFWNQEFRTAVDTGVSRVGKGAIRMNPMKFGMDTMRIIESADKLGMMAARLRAGDDMLTAVANTNHALFQYGVVSPAVQLARKSGLAPFAAWSAKNIPLQMELLLKRPGTFAALCEAKKALEDGHPYIPNAALPKYLQDKIGIQIGKNKDGTVNFLLADGVVPMADLPKVMDIQGLLEQLLGPIPKIVMETFSGVDSFTKEKISKFDGDFSVYKLMGQEIRIPKESGFWPPKISENFLKNAIGRPYSLVTTALRKSQTMSAKGEEMGIEDLPAAQTALWGFGVREVGKPSDIETNLRDLMSQYSAAKQESNKNQRLGNQESAKINLEQMKKIADRVRVLRQYAAKARLAR